MSCSYILTISLSCSSGSFPSRSADDLLSAQQPFQLLSRDCPFRPRRPGSGRKKGLHALHPEYDPELVPVPSADSLSAAVESAVGHMTPDLAMQRHLAARYGSQESLHGHFQPQGHHHLQALAQSHLQGPIQGHLPPYNAGQGHLGQGHMETDSSYGESLHHSIGEEGKSIHRVYKKCKENLDSQF